MLPAMAFDMGRRRKSLRLYRMEMGSRTVSQPPYPPDRIPIQVVPTAVPEGRTQIPMGLITRQHHQPQVAALARLEMVLGEALEATTLAAVDPAAVERVQADRAGAARVVDPGMGDPEVEV